MAIDYKNRPTVNGVGVVLQGETVAEVELAADVANANATANALQDVTGLSFAVNANVTYRFRFTILYDAALATTGARFTLNGPATTLLGYKAWVASGTGADTVSNMNTYNSGTVATASAFATGNVAVVWGIIRPSAAGRVILRFASEVGGSAITVKAGSTVEIW